MERLRKDFPAWEFGWEPVETASGPSGTVYWARHRIAPQWFSSSHVGHLRAQVAEAEGHR